MTPIINRIYKYNIRFFTGFGFISGIDSGLTESKDQKVTQKVLIISKHTIYSTMIWYGIGVALPIMIPYLCYIKINAK